MVWRPLLFVTLLVPVLACDSAESDADDVVPLGEIEASEGGKSDDIGARAIGWRKGKEVVVSGTEADATAAVTSVTDTEMTVESDLYVLTPAADETLTVSIDSSLVSDAAFMMMYRAPGDDEWSPLEIDGAVDQVPFTGFLFEDVSLDPITNRGEFGLILGTNVGLLHHRATLSLAGIAGGEYAVAPIPIGTWGDLEGDYSLTFEVECDGGAC